MQHLLDSLLRVFNFFFFKLILLFLLNLSLLYPSVEAAHNTALDQKQKPQIETFGPVSAEKTVSAATHCVFVNVSPRVVKIC